MTKRIVSGVVLFPIMAAIIVCGGVPLELLVLTISLIGMFEIYRAFSKKLLPVHFVGYLFAIIMMFFNNLLRDTGAMLAIIILFALSTLVMAVLMHKTITPLDVAITTFGLIYVAVLMSTVYIVRNSDHGYLFVWLIFISAWGCDTGAYFTGVTIGKHQAFPELSPKKTIEGLVGGVLTASILGLIFGYFADMHTDFNDVNTVLFCVVACFVGAIFSIFGDLTASAIKRYTGIKDYGNIIPGHGGIMDRFDSVLFTAPAVYIVTILLVK